MSDTVSTEADDEPLCGDAYDHSLKLIEDDEEN